MRDFRQKIPLKFQNGEADFNQINFEMLRYFGSRGVCYTSDKDYEIFLDNRIFTDFYR